MFFWCAGRVFRGFTRMVFGVVGALLAPRIGIVVVSLRVDELGNLVVVEVSGESGMRSPRSSASPALVDGSGEELEQPADDGVGHSPPTRRHQRDQACWCCSVGLLQPRRPSRCRRKAASKVEKIAFRVRSTSHPSQAQQASNVTTPMLPSSIQ